MSVLKVSQNRQQSPNLKTLNGFSVLVLLVASLSGLCLEAADPPRSPVAPQDSLAHLQLAPGLRADLVAAEPQVTDPVAVRFDARGRMWVVEMRDYPWGPKEGELPQCQLRVLTDEDGDGFFETSRIFADQLLFTTGIQPWKGGVIVTMAGQVAYFKDTTGDGRADLRQTWYRGFVEDNSQLRANHPRFGLDNHIYIANGLRGGVVQDARQPNSPKVNINNMDFRFHPETKHDLPWESGHGSLAKMKHGNGNLLFAIHPLVVKRKDLTCFVSYNEGKTWPYKKLLHEIGGYSSTIVLDNYDIAMSHNHGFRGEHGIDFVRFNLSWLTDGKEHAKEPIQLLSQKPESKTTHRVIWREDFELSDRTIIDGGATAWRISEASDAPIGAAVSNGKFRASDTGREIVWKTEEIDIGTAKRISIAVDAIKIGNFEESDSLRIYYRLGDGDEELIESLSFSSDPQEDFETYRIRKHDLNTLGHQQVQVIIRSRINGDNKVLYWDRIEVARAE